MIYPNPVSHYIINDKESNVKLYDARGVLMITTSDKLIDVRELSPGYYYAVIDGVGFIIIKQ